MVKYVYDSKGKKTGVIISIDVWEKTKSKIIAIENKKEFHPLKFRGIYSNMKIDLDEEAKKTT
jgi:hypothetical protein